MKAPILHIPPAEDTPEASLNGITGELSIKGSSLSNNPSDFYKTVLAWLDLYIKQPSPHTTLTLRLVYINSPAIGYISEILKKMKTLTALGHDVKTVWQYEKDDKDMMDIGNVYASVAKIPFEVLEVA